MSDDYWNPGKSVLSAGLLALVFQMIGVSTAHQGDEAPISGLIGLAATAVITIFIASVVGSYYAGKRRR